MGVINIPDKCAMIEIPPESKIQFQRVLAKKEIPKRFHGECLKWLRYYLDFCHKYGFEDSKKESLPDFIKKLKAKGQNSQQQKRATRAISIYYETKLSRADEKTALRKQDRTSSPSKALLKPTHADWRSVYDGLDSEIKLRHYSPKTLRAYKGWVRHLQAFTKSKDPRLLSGSDVKGFLTHLAVKRKVSASSQNQAFNSLLFFFRHILKQELGELKDVPRAKRKPYVPVVLSRQEVDAVIGALFYPYDLIVKLLYGCGLRLFECLNLRVQDLNYDNEILTVHDGKGKKDRTVPLPQKVIPELKTHLESVIALHEQDLRAGYAGAFLMGSLEKKYKNAPKELVWQWFFPAKTLTLVPETKQYRRYHIHETHVQKAIRRAVNKSKIRKRATAHTFRHSYASHLLQANYDIRTIQELLGHSDVRTTMVYTHTIKSLTIKEAKSPLDF
jgi:integron integrase